MNKILTFLTILILSFPAQATDTKTEWCSSLALAYRVAVNLRDSGMTPEDIYKSLSLVGGFTPAVKQEILTRTYPIGELGFMSSKTIYTHIYKDCMAN